MRHLRTAFLILVTAAIAGLAIAQAESRAEETKTPRKLLFFTRSVGFQHSVVKVEDGKPCYAETILQPICKEHGWELESTKDGRVFTPENLAKYDAILFYTQGDLEAESKLDHSAPMTKEGKQALLDAVKGGKGFVGFHCASDTFHSPGEAWETQPRDQRDPYINMVGGEFIVHQSQQETTMKVADSKFPGAGKLGDGFKMLEEWYSLKNFADDLHVLLVNETKDMHDKCYQRPPYPATWIRNHGKGRVFYTSMGHREDVWTRPEFQSIVIGGITWAVGDAKADTTPNINKVTPEANVMPTR